MWRSRDQLWRLAVHRSNIVAPHRNGCQDNGPAVPTLWLDLEKFAIQGLTVTVPAARTRSSSGSRQSALRAPKRSLEDETMNIQGQDP
jgi:hypothetical protein